MHCVNALNSSHKRKKNVLSKFYTFYLNYENLKEILKDTENKKKHNTLLYNIEVNINMK